MTLAVAAVVVTRNRKILLHECLAALRAQSLPPTRIYLIDNASDDGTPDALSVSGWLDDPALIYVRSERNTGGAGGFHIGMARAYADGHEWLWVMDDDAVPMPDALAELAAAHARLTAAATPPALLCSRVEWDDGRIHPFNVPAPRYSREQDAFFTAAASATIAIRACSFVSVVINRSLIARHGLPRADFFIWQDDVEFTARVLRDAFGVAVPASRVRHRTAIPHTLADAAPERFYYYVRNSLWMLLWCDAFRGRERWWRLMVVTVTMVNYIGLSFWRPLRWWWVVLGMCRGVFTSPLKVTTPSSDHIFPLQGVPK